MVLDSRKYFLTELICGEDQRAEAAVSQIAALGTEVLPDLLEFLSSPDADIRWWGVRVLSEIDDPGVPLRLIEMLGDAEASIRQCAALGLRLHPEEKAIPHLIQALDDHDRLYAALAADALVAVGATTVPALLDVMQNGSQSARLEAVRALALIGDTRAIPALFAALDESSALMGYWADHGLERMGVGMIFFKP